MDPLVALLLELGARAKTAEPRVVELEREVAELKAKYEPPVEEKKES